MRLEPPVFVPTLIHRLVDALPAAGLGPLLWKLSVSVHNGAHLSRSRAVRDQAVHHVSAVYAVWKECEELYGGNVRGCRKREVS